MAFWVKCRRSFYASGISPLSDAWLAALSPVLCVAFHSAVSFDALKFVFSMWSNGSVFSFAAGTLSQQCKETAGSHPVPLRHHCVGGRRLRGRSAQESLEESGGALPVVVSREAGQAGMGVSLCEEQQVNLCG